MTIQEIIDQFGGNSGIIINYYIVLLVLSLIGLLFVNTGNFKSPINYLYTVLLYAVCVPALFSFVLLLYSFFFLRANLLQVNALAYYLPIVSLVLLLVIIKKTIPLKSIPGFEKISGLFMIIIVSFIITYILQRMFFGVFFIGSFKHLIAIFVVLLIIIRLGWRKIMR